MRVKKYYPYLFLCPFFILLLLFGIFPIFYAAFISLNKWNGIGAMEFVGLKNYATLLKDDLFIKSVANTIIIALFAVPITNILGLVVAFILNNLLTRREKDIFQATYFLPYITTGIAIGYLFGLIFDWQNGIFNHLLLTLHLIKEPVNWAGLPQYTKPIVILVVAWKYFGHSMVMFMAGLQSISKDVYEAARVDGASVRQVFFRITLPLLKNIMVFIFVTSTIGCLQLFEEPLMLFAQGNTMSYGGPDRQAYTALMHMYVSSFKDLKFGYGAAVSYGIFFVVMAFSFITNKIIIGREKA